MGIILNFMNFVKKVKTKAVATEQSILEFVNKHKEEIKGLMACLDKIYDTLGGDAKMNILIKMVICMVNVKYVDYSDEILAVIKNALQGVYNEYIA